MSIFHPKMNLPHQNRSHPKKSAVPSPNINASDNESNYSSDNNESDLDGECPTEPINTSFVSPGMIKGDHKIYDQFPYEKMASWLYYSTANHFVAICAKFVR